MSLEEQVCLFLGDATFSARVAASSDLVIGLAADLAIIDLLSERVEPSRLVFHPNCGHGRRAPARPSSTVTARPGQSIGVCKKYRENNTNQCLKQKIVRFFRVFLSTTEILRHFFGCKPGWDGTQWCRNYSGLTNKIFPVDVGKLCLEAWCCHREVREKAGLDRTQATGSL